MLRGFLDTNILLYSISTAEAEAGKREMAQGLLDQDGWGLSVQVLQEFYVQATRKSRPDPLPPALARDFVEVWLRFAVQEITPPLMLRAFEIQAAHGLSYWDSAIIAAALALGAPKLYSEDLQHGRVIEGMEIVNPFR
jgi:predicted nucleic acid-binding protein